MDYGDYRAGATTDFFWFKGKRGLIEVLLGKVPATGTLKILNAGAGTGDDISVIKAFGDVYVVDTLAEALEMVPAELVAEKKVGDVTALDYPDGFFDIVLAFDLLEHVEHDAEAVSELHRVLKPGGHFLFTVPAFNSLLSEHDRRLGHYRRYNMKTLDTLLGDFDCAARGYWMTFLFPLLLVARLTEGLRRSSDSFPHIPALVNSLFCRVLGLENRMVRAGIRMPVGATIYGICTKR